MTPANEHLVSARGCHKYSGSLSINKSSLVPCADLDLSNTGRGKCEGGNLQKLSPVVCLPRNKLTEN